jgi:hypothetical protein
MNAYLVWVVTSVLIGVVVAVIAARCKRNPLGWFLVGVLLNVLVLGLITMLEKRARRV